MLTETPRNNNFHWFRADGWLTFGSKLDGWLTIGLTLKWLVSGWCPFQTIKRRLQSKRDHPNPLQTTNLTPETSRSTPSGRLRRTPSGARRRPQSAARRAPAPAPGSARSPDHRHPRKGALREPLGTILLLVNPLASLLCHDQRHPKWWVKGKQPPLSDFDNPQKPSKQ